MSDLPPPPFVGGSLPPPPFDSSLPPPPRQGGGGLPPPPMDAGEFGDYDEDAAPALPPAAHPHPKALSKEPANEYQSLPDFSRYEAELDAQKAAATPAVLKPTRSLPLPTSPPAQLPPPVVDEPPASDSAGGDEDHFPPPSDPPPASSDSLPPPPIAEPPPFNEDAAPVDSSTGDQYQVLPRAPGSDGAGDGLAAAIRNSRGPPPTLSRNSMRRDMPPPAAAGPASSVPATRPGPGQPLPRTSMRGPPSRTPAAGSLARGGGGGGTPAVMGIGGLPGINAPVPENAPPPPGMPNLPPPVTTPVPNLPMANGPLNLPPIGSLPPPGQLPPPGALPSGLPPAPGAGGPGGPGAMPPARRMPARPPASTAPTLPTGPASASATNLSVPGSGGGDATLGRPPSPGVGAPAPAVPTRGPAVTPRGLPQHQSQPANLRAAAPDGRPAAAAPAAAPADAITPAPLTQHNGEEMYRPPGMGIIKDGSVIKGTAFDKKKNVRWAILYKDRIDMSIQLPQKNQQAMPEVKHVIQLAGCSVELNKKDPKEVVIKDAKGKKFDSFSCDKPEDAEQWVKYIGLVIAKLPKSASSKGSGAKNKPAKVFGTDMATLLAWDRQADPTLAVPQIVIECLAFLQNDTVLQTEGLFRLSGSLTKIMEFKALYDAFKPANIADATDPNVVSGVLKLWLREMPEPLMLYENYDEFIRVAKAGGPDELAQYRALCDTLPLDNLNLLRVLMWLCRDVANYEEINKMSPTNLAIVFGPNLLKSQSVDMMTAAEDSQYINDIFKKIIIDPEQVVGPRELAVLHVAVADDSAAAAASGDFNGGAPMNGVDSGVPAFAHSASSPAFTDVPATPQDSGNALRLELLASEPSNAACADCSAPDPAYVSLNTGALLCQACSGAHAGTLAIQMNPQGAPLSRPAAIAAAAGDPLIADMLRKCSNQRLNQALEHSVPAGIKPQPNAPDAVRKKFVMAKYAQRAFADHNALQRTQQSSLLELLQEGDFARFQAAVLLGANTAALSPEGAPIHEAVRQRDAAAIVLLVLNGADANAVAPAEGVNAHQLAQQCGDARIEKFLEQHAVLPTDGAGNKAAPPEKRPPFGAVNMFGDAPPTLRRGPAVRGPRGPQAGMPAPGRPPPSGPPARGPEAALPSATPPFGGIGIAASAMAARRGPPGPVGGPGAPAQPGGPARRAMPGMGAPGLGGPPGGVGGGPPPAGARPDRVPPGPMGGGGGGGGVQGPAGGGGAAPAAAAPAAAAASGPVDPNYIDLAGNDLSKCDWFHGKISSADAFKLLSVEAKGAFLLRCSSRPGHFVVSWVQDVNNIIHTLVSPRAGGGGYDVEGDQRQYLSVPAIMQQYAKHLAKLVPRTGKLV